jgi:glycerate kinase
LKVVIAPDSFKGSINNFDCAAALAEGWSSIRPLDEVILMPMADGGEGTLETIAASNTGALRMKLRGGARSYWLLLKDGTAIVELANICGITLLTKLDPMGAHTFALGEALKEAAVDSRVKRIIVAVGGSASTDGGVGALMALGAQFLNRNGEVIGRGGNKLAEIASIDFSQMVKPPIGGVVCLVDVKNLMLGPLGAAEVFSPQKGASPMQVLELELGLEHWREISVTPDFEGAGAAGGTPFGLSLGWPILISSGAESIASLIGLREVMRGADLVITGEGRLDSQSFSGKVVGEILRLAADSNTKIAYCVGSTELSELANVIALVDLAPSIKDALENPQKWLAAAAALCALVGGWE